MRLAVVLTLAAAAAATAQKAPAHHLLCRQIWAGELVTPSEAIKRGAGRADFFAGCAALPERRWADAVASFEKAQAADTMDAVYRLWLGRARSEELRRAAVFRQMTLLPQVKGDINRAAEMDSTLVEARMGQIELLLMTPRAFGGDRDQARAKAEALRSMAPFFGAMALARVAIVSGDTAAGERELRSLVKAHPDSVVPLVSLLALMVTSGRPAEALKIVAGLKRTPALSLIGDFYTGYVAAMTNENVPAGEAALRRYVSAVRPYGFPRRVVAHWNLARIEERRGRRAEAIAELRKSLALDPEYEPAKKDLERLLKEP